MSTSDTPATPPLTRRQLRELRQTGATPIITPQIETPDATAPAPEAEVSASSESQAPALIEALPAAAEENAPAEEFPAPVAPAPADEQAAPAAEERPAEEDRTTSSPAAASSYGDAAPDLGVAGLTRRQVRAQEKIRTASVPVISPDLDVAQPRSGSAAPVDDDVQPAIFRPAAAEENPPTEAPAPSVVNPALGSELLDGPTPGVALPPSFDQLLARNTGATGAVTTPNSLILSQTPTGAPLVGPVNATGEIMITGTFDLPAGLGSVGHAPGTTDGRDVDAVLLDGELPAASSPTPIAASAAISTVKQPGEIIRPPAPEKGSKLLIALIITTGVLALGVAVTLGLAFTTGVFR
ncbi:MULTISPECIES: hypothetical protein [Microbacterium]|uniref:hypothetical protein n=1 Tax=Microbacterium TaxID=33882 RepID=UPI002788FECB|nr:MULTISPECIES: hypothetical protein [Microbacterium]MDQ1084095.1 hypothetical protein [Microbacterium sp. SORGH_AS_0344]MDQ1170629.1 hypothetical protein [Microbacterium proteolyticum]